MPESIWEIGASGWFYYKELSAATHPTMQRHMPEDQIFLFNPDEEQYKAFHILQYHY